MGFLENMWSSPLIPKPASKPLNDPRELPEDAWNQGGPTDGSAWSLGGGSYTPRSPGKQALEVLKTLNKGY